MTETIQPAETSGVRVFPPGFYLGALALGFALNIFWPVRFPDGQRLLWRLLGGVAVVVWMGLVLSAVATFRRARTSLNPTKPTAALASGGPYRFTRNPMYLSFIFMVLGVSLLGNSVWPILFLPAAILCIRRMVIDKEEAYLERKFGQPYLDYKGRVRRWL